VNNKTLKISKKLCAVTLWVHPEGRVVGSLYLKEQDTNNEENEQPLDVLNRCNPFLVFKIDDPDELRFYNVKSVTRVEYESSGSGSSAGSEPMQCHLHMMDGSFIHGRIFESLPPDRARLLDYLNRGEENFIKVHVDDGQIYLINKSYINHVHVTGIGDTEGDV
jgi:hypothetical protein